MLFSTAGQAWIFLATVYCGIGVGCLYDGNRIVRNMLRAGRIACALADILFWAAACVWMALALYWAGSGILRAYMLLGVLCGWGLYELAVSPIVRALYRAAKRLGKKFHQSTLGKYFSK